MCHSVPGVDSVGTWTGPLGTTYDRHACSFVVHGHGFMFIYSVLRAIAADLEAVLRSIIDATQFNF